VLFVFKTIVTAEVGISCLMFFLSLATSPRQLRESYFLPYSSASSFTISSRLTSNPTEFLEVSLIVTDEIPGISSITGRDAAIGGSALEV
jgi:hypothetical protein